MNLGEDPNTGYIAESLWVPKTHINVEGVKTSLTFPYFRGPDREQFELPLYREAEHHLIVPREFWVHGTFDFPVFDLRPRHYSRTGIKSRILLDNQKMDDGSLVPTGETLQRDALAAMLAARGGTLQLGCGKGKTVIALHAIAILQVPALIVIDNIQLLMQWQREIEKLLEVPGGVGMVGDGVFDWEGRSIVLATYKTLAMKRATLPEAFRRWFGVIVFEESHHLDAPTFSKSADLIYGRRYGLSATPKRPDGLHVIHEFHVGSVFFKYLKQDLKPRIYFYWTGLHLDMKDPTTVLNTCTASGELHLSKLAVWFGQWRARLDLIIRLVRKAHEEGRRILVLANSVDELVNLLALWNNAPSLYTDIPAPEALPNEPAPHKLTKKGADAIEKKIEALGKKVHGASPATQMEIQAKVAELTIRLAQHEAHKRTNKLMNAAQKEYLKNLLLTPSDAGLMIYKVSPEERVRMLQEKDVTFAIRKYGKEGLDEPSIDTIFLCEPVSESGGIQQVMGRALRPKENKKTPCFTILEDDIFPITNMCKKMRRHLRDWPLEDGGPYTYELVGYPIEIRKRR